MWTWAENHSCQQKKYYGTPISWKPIIAPVYTQVHRPRPLAINCISITVIIACLPILYVHVDVQVWFTSLHVRAVMPVMSAKQSSIVPCMHVKEHLTSDRASHIFKHLQNSEH